MKLMSYINTVTDPKTTAPTDSPKAAEATGLKEKNASFTEVLTDAMESKKTDAGDKASDVVTPESYDGVMASEFSGVFGSLQFHEQPEASNELLPDEDPDAYGYPLPGESLYSDPLSYEYEWPDAADPQTSNVDYSAMIADALQEELARMSISAGSGFSDIPGGYLPMQDQGIEQMILAAASSGQANDAQIALFMLCMMMQTSQDSDFSMLMQMMATMLTQIQGDTETLRNNVMSSGYDQNVLDSINRNVFGARIPGLSGTNSAVIPVDGWVPTSPAIISTEAYRDPRLYRAVVNQFMVETSERYQNRDGKTYCNIFVWDVTSAMGAEIPHYTDPVTGQPRDPNNKQGAIAMGAIRIDAWLAEHGNRYGWREVDAETAQRYANSGRPAVTSAGSRRHVQVIVPSRDGGYDPVRGVTIAQAGGRLTNYAYITSIYSAEAMREDVRYWVHE